MDFSIKSAFQKIGSGLQTVAAEFGSLQFAFTNILRGLQGVALFAVDNPAIKMIISIAGVAKSGFEAIAQVPKVHTARLLHTDLFEHVRKPDSQQSLAGRINDLTQSVAYIQTNEKRIRTITGIAKEAGIAKRATDILAELSSASNDEQIKAVEKGEEFVKTLRTRVSQKLGFELTKLLNRIAGVVVSSLLIPFPLNPITLSLAGGVGVMALVVWGAEKLVLTKDPFIDPKDTLSYKISAATQKLADIVKGVFQPKAQQQQQPQPQLVAA
jgi:hypothetical protein